MAETPSNDVIVERIEGLKSLLNERFNEQGDKINEVYMQAKKTNGRVSKLEVWRGLIIGGLIITNIIVVPIFFMVLDHLIRK